MLRQMNVLRTHCQRLTQAVSVEKLHSVVEDAAEGVSVAVGERGDAQADHVEVLRVEIGVLCVARRRHRRGRVQGTLLGHTSRSGPATRLS